MRSVRNNAAVNLVVRQIASPSAALSGDAGIRSSTVSAVAARRLRLVSLLDIVQFGRADYEREHGAGHDSGHGSRSIDTTPSAR
jgi:hypothetical protein